MRILIQLSTLCIAVASIPPGGVPDTVTFEGGQVTGVKLPDGNLRYWLGVPYADTTGPGNLSWLPPRSRPSWTTPLDGSEFGPGCWQARPLGLLVEALSSIVIKSIIYSLRHFLGMHFVADAPQPGCS